MCTCYGLWQEYYLLMFMSVLGDKSMNNKNIASSLVVFSFFIAPNMAEAQMVNNFTVSDAVDSGSIGVGGTAANGNVFVASSNPDNIVVRRDTDTTTSVLNVISDITANSKSGGCGIHLYTGKLDLVGAAGIDVTFDNNDHGGVTVAGSGSTAGIETLKFIGFSTINADGNGWGYGINSGAALYFEGLGVDDTLITAKNNNKTTDKMGFGVDGTLGIKDATVDIEGNDTVGIGVDGGDANIEDSKVLLTDNGYGVSIINDGDFTFHNTDVVATGQDDEVINIAGGSVFRITATALGTNTFEATANSGDIIRNASADGSNATLYISNMTVNIHDNAGGSAFVISGNSKNLIEGSSINIINNSGYGFNLSGASTAFQINNSDVDISDNGSDAIYIRSGANMAFDGDGTNILLLDNNDTAISVSGSGSSLTVSTTDVTINDNNVSIFVGDSATVSFVGKAGRNSLDITASADDKAIVVDDGAVSIANMSITTDADVFADISNDGSVTLNNSLIAAAAGETLFNVTGDGNINIENGSNVTSIDTAVFNVDNTGSLAVVVEDSSVSTGNGLALISMAASGDASLNADGSVIRGFVDRNGGSLDMGLVDTSWYIRDNSSVSQLVADSDSNIYITSGVSGDYNNLTVEDWDVDGNVYMQTEFGVDSSPTDMITITNSAIGNSTLFIANDGGSGAGVSSDGIKVVDAQGLATTDNNAFSLYNGKVYVGAYEYYLEKGGVVAGTDDESWFLRNSGVLNSVAGVLINEPAILVNMSKTGMNSLNKRMGYLRDNDHESREGVWGRTYAKDLEIDDFIDVDMTLYGVEVGYDQRFDFDCDYKIYAGVMAGYMYSNDVKHRSGNYARVDGTTKAPSIGAYATWLNYDGWHVDAVIRTFWSDMNIHAYTPTGNRITIRPDRQITSASLEVGKQIELVQDDDTKLIIEPKAEVIASNATSDKFRANNGNKVEFGDSSSVMGKATVAVMYNKKLENQSKITPHLHVSLLNEFDGDTNITYDGTKYKSNLKGMGFEVGFGLNMQVDKQTSVYSDFTYEKGAVVEAIGGNVGVRYTW